MGCRGPGRTDRPAAEYSTVTACALLAPGRRRAPMARVERGGAVPESCRRDVCAAPSAAARGVPVEQVRPAILRARPGLLGAPARDGRVIARGEHGRHADIPEDRWSRVLGVLE